MHHTEIRPNLVVVVRGEPSTVVRLVSGEHVEVQIFSSRKKIVVDVGELVFLPPIIEAVETGCSNVLNEPDVPDRIKIQASERFLAIRKYLSGELNANQAMAITNTKKSAFYALLEKFNEDLGVSSLYPGTPGREAGRTTLSDEVETIISDAVEKIYKGAAATYIKVWEEVKAKCSKLELPVPSLSAVTARVKKLGEHRLHQLRYGAESADQKYGAKPGKILLSHPLERVQIDHTVVDCILVDEETRSPLFRPWVTLLIDVYTRVIIGYYVAFHAPSLVSVACAITHAVLPKRQYLDGIGREDVSHPFYGTPEILHMDNAKEFRSSKLIAACAIHEIKPEWRPLGKKHYGGHIERLIGTMMTTKVHFLPGTTMSNIVERGKIDSEKNSALTIGEFTAWFAGEVEVYNFKEHSALRCAPAKKWEKSFISPTGLVTQPKAITDPFKFRLDFMPEERRKIHPVGIKMFRREYWAPELKSYVGMRNVTIKYDPYTLYTAWAKINGEYIEVHFSDLTTDDLSYEEHLIGNAVHYLGKSKVMDPGILRVRERNENLVEESRRETKKSRKKEHAIKAYSSHSLNQHFDSPSRHSERPKVDVDYSKPPTIYDSEDM